MGQLRQLRLSGTLGPEFIKLTLTVTGAVHVCSATMMSAYKEGGKGI